MSTKMPLTVGDRDLGKATWVTFAEGIPSARLVRRSRLTVLAGPDQGLTRDFDAAIVRVGGRRTADLRLSDERVSGLHLEIRLIEDGIRLVDLDSTNGTWLLGYRVHEVGVASGAVVELGQTQLRVETLDEATEVPLSGRDRLVGMVGGSPAMRELYARIERAAAADATVLVSGETGSGKELVAEALHALSPRAAGPLVVVDCGALPLNLVESELYGHERGAFTGAHESRAGAFERARGGTLFLDEVGELPLEVQPKLLRALERREIRRVGGAQAMTVDVRVVAATHRDLEREVARGAFREDLYYRLAVIRLAVPPLRERPGDIPLLVEHFLAELTGAGGAAPAAARPTAQALEQLAGAEWRGNVRELRNAVERLVLLGDPPGIPPQAAAEMEVDAAVPYKVARARLLASFEKSYLEALLARHGGNLSAAARAAGIDRMSIHRLLQRTGLRPRGGGGGVTGSQG